MEKDIWKLQQEYRELRLAQIDAAERLTRLERRQDEDFRMKSLWKSPSPFPALLSSAVSLANSNHSLIDPQEDIDVGLTNEQENDFLSRLSLDEVEVPRRGVSRANSVRFDDAIQSHWISDSKRAVAHDYFAAPRSGSSQLGGHPMDERSSSYKSEGGQSSVRSHSVGRGTNSIFDDDARDPSTLSSQGPLLIQPAIIQCSLDEHNNTLHFATVCSGSDRSLIEYHVLDSMGLHHLIEKGDNVDKIELPVYLPFVDVSYHSAKSTSSLVSICVYFNVIADTHTSYHQASPGILIGSDVLAAGQADVSFSRNLLTISVDDGRRVVVPFQKLEYKDGFTNIRAFPLEIQYIWRSDMIDADHSSPVQESKSAKRGSIVSDVQPEINMEKAALSTRGSGIGSGSSRPNFTVYSTQIVTSHPDEGDSAICDVTENMQGSKCNTFDRTIVPGDELSKEQAAAQDKDSRSSSWFLNRLSSIPGSSTQIKEAKTASNSISSKRGMKVLRPSRTNSLGDHSLSRPFPAWSQSTGKFDPNKPNTVTESDRSQFQKTEDLPGPNLEGSQEWSKSIGDARLSERPSSSDRTSKKLGHTKNKMSNVVGGASAFRWMERTND